ncbi:MAG: Tex family protein [Desulfobacterales bacterium]|nr:Tex family protein [Desulfobacterales bacterium]
MNDAHIAAIVTESGLSPAQVSATAALLAEGATVPFVARYRKEATGSLDEIQITLVRDRLHALAALDARREAVLKSLEQHGHLTDELKAKIDAAASLSELEDLYLPYRPKRRTRATVAREKGLAPLAQILFEQNGCLPVKEAAAFVDPEKGVADSQEALAGARDIMAEMVNENPAARADLRQLFAAQAVIRSTVATGQEAAGAKYRDYFDWTEPAASAPSHRILAIRRGEREDMLNVSIAPAEEAALALLESRFVRGSGEDAEQVRLALHDGYRRLLSRAMETETRVALKERADREAIRVFAENLRQLLLAPPLGPKRVLGIDPGFRTGCKVVCLDPQGKLLHHDTLFFHTSEKRREEAVQKMAALCEAYQIEAIAVGNGTAGRETETLVTRLPCAQGKMVLLVNESGASIYSASETAREEFPDLDLTVRGAVSIARRLMDPLAELVKIDPKSIGVGQYQHDVDPGALKEALDDVVVSCVNAVGVDVNMASAELLTYVSGLGPRLARTILLFRNENGPFRSRADLKQVPRLGPKAFEQSAGFLRVKNGAHPLDASAVHPESYPIVDRMARDLGRPLTDLLAAPQLHQKIDLPRYVTETVGLPTLTDILKELAKPGRDPRDNFEAFHFAEGVATLEDLQPGMKLPGVVTNVTAFGAFVDIGVHQDGLVHVSELADRFVRDPAQVVRLQQRVKVTVLEVDLARRRISLSMKSAPAEALPREQPAAPRTDAPGRPKGRRQTSQKETPQRPFNNPFGALLDRSKKR